MTKKLTTLIVLNSVILPIVEIGTLLVINNSNKDEKLILKHKQDYEDYTGQLIVKKESSVSYSFNLPLFSNNKTSKITNYDGDKIILYPLTKKFNHISNWSSGHGSSYGGHTYPRYKAIVESFKFDRNSFDVDFYDSNTLVDYLKLSLSGMKESWNKHRKTLDFTKILIDSLKVKLEINVDLENYSDSSGKRYIKAHRVIFKIIYSYDEIVHDNAIIKTFQKKLKESMPNTIEVKSDTGSSNGLITPLWSKDSIRGFKSNSFYLNEALKKEWDKIKKPSLYNFRYHYHRISSSKIILYASFLHHSFHNKRFRFKIKTINLKFKNSTLFYSKALGARLILEEGKWFRKEGKKFIYGKDIGILKDVSKVTPSFGGEWIYHSPVKISFESLKDESEVLFINGKKIDVINQKFEFDLNDTRSKILDEEGNVVKTGTNKYEIEIRKFKKIGNKNDKVLANYKKTIIIEGKNDVINNIWFAWDPENIPTQRKLIQKYLVDNKGKEILDEKDKKVPNPLYDPLIDVTTGTKKEIIWVNRDIESLNYLPDPLDQNGRDTFINSGVNAGVLKQGFRGFFAEAAILGKGVSIQEVEKHFKDGLIQNELFYSKDLNEFRQNKFKKIDFHNQNTYLSDEGIYIFAARINKGLDSIKIVAIGKNDVQQSFTEQYIDNGVYGWTPFWNTYHGENLRRYIKESEDVSENEIELLSYENILYYWKKYVSKKLKNILDNKVFKIKVEPIIDIQKILDYTNTITRNEFNPSKKEQDSWVKDFTNSNLVSIVASLDSASGHVKIDFQDISVDQNLEILGFPNIIFVYFREDEKQKEEVEQAEKNETRIKINFALNKKYVENVLDGLNNDLLNKIDKTYFEKNKLFTKNQDKLDFNVLKEELVLEQNHFAINIVIKVLDPKKYYIPFSKLNNYFIINRKNIPQDNDKKPIKRLKELGQVKTPKKEQNKDTFDQDGNLIRRNLFVQNIRDLNLKGLATRKDIKKAIIQHVSKQVSSIYKFDVDYKIEPLDNDVLDKLINVQLDMDGIEKIIFTASILNKDKYFGYKTFRVYNFVEAKIKNIVNLGELILKDLSLNDNNFESLKIKIQASLYQPLLLYGLELDKNIRIENFDGLVQALVITKGNNEASFKLVPLDNQIKGFKVFKVKNRVENVIEKLQLARIKFDDLKVSEALREKLLAKIKQKIIADFLKFGIDKTKVKASVYNNVKFLDSLLFLNPKLTMKRNRVVFTNKEDINDFTFMNIINTYDSKVHTKENNEANKNIDNATIIDPEVPEVTKTSLIDKDDGNNVNEDNNDNISEEKKLTRKITYGILYSLLVIGSIGLIFIAKYLYTKQVTKKIK